MTHFHAQRPQPDEHLPYFHRYVQLVPEGDVLVTLQRQLSESLTRLRALTEEQSNVRPAPGEWNAKEILGHVNDGERIFAHRALWFARGDAQALPGIEPLDYMRSAAFDQRRWTDVVNEFETIRRATLSLLLSFDEAAWDRRGVASGHPVSVRALAFIIAGHELEHLAAIQQQAV